MRAARIIEVVVIGSGVVVVKAGGRVVSPEGVAVEATVSNTPN